VGTAANTTDNPTNSAKYAAAGVSEYFLRNFPQFSSMLVGVNNGRSYYDSLQIRLQRQLGALRVVAAYTRSKSLDNDQSSLTSGEGNSFVAPIDSFNGALAKGLSNYDIPNAFTMTGIYTLPIGRGHLVGGNMPKWADSAFGGWDLGGLWIWESGEPFTASSGRATTSSTQSTYANYSGSRDIGQVAATNNGIGSGVYYFTEAQIANFSFPTAGFIGNSGRNAFRGPGFFNVDLALVKRFALTEHIKVLFRTEAYNLFNNVDFANPNATLTSVNFGKITSVVNNPRVMQLALRLEF
jgi:hypothetical protein